MIINRSSWSYKYYNWKNKINRSSWHYQVYKWTDDPLDRMGYPVLSPDNPFIYWYKVLLYAPWCLFWIGVLRLFQLIFVLFSLFWLLVLAFPFYCLICAYKLLTGKVPNEGFWNGFADMFWVEHVCGNPPDIFRPYKKYPFRGQRFSCRCERKPPFIP